ncbi:MAG: N-6 DNA methylase, partial [Proteobacteria bacterium]|nr:N-6 DNA methylase [Pseudomonadota bacterium]
NQKTVLSETEEQQIIDTFNDKQAIEDFSVVVDYKEIKTKNYSLSAGQYFEVKIEYTDITQDEFKAKMTEFENNLDELFIQSKDLEKEIKQNLKELNYE